MQIFPPNFPLQVVKHHCHEHVFLIVIKQFDLWADISQIRTKSVSVVLYEIQERTLLFASLEPDLPGRFWNWELPTILTLSDTDPLYFYHLFILHCAEYIVYFERSAWRILLILRYHRPITQVAYHWKWWYHQESYSRHLFAILVT